MKRLLALGALLVSLAVHAAEGPYDEKADAKAQIRQTLAAAAAAGTPIIVVFGANWCGDCRMLDKAMKEGASAPLIAREFRVVKVDARKMGENGVYEYFKGISSGIKPKS